MSLHLHFNLWLWNTTYKQSFIQRERESGETLKTDDSFYWIIKKQVKKFLQVSFLHQISIFKITKSFHSLFILCSVNAIIVLQKLFCQVFTVMGIKEEMATHFPLHLLPFQKWF